MGKNLAKTYDPKDFEDRIYEMWEKNGAFRAEADPDKKPFTIVMPPPNITGQLHMGHALDQTLQDVLTRFKRLQGYSALWLPGSDHASIATEVKVVDRIRKEEGLEKEDLGREEFLRRACAQWGKTVLTNRCTDLLNLARRRIFGVPNYQLSTLAKHLELPCKEVHRAQKDCELMLQLYFKLNEFS